MHLFLPFPSPPHDISFFHSSGYYRAPSTMRRHQESAATAEGHATHARAGTPHRPATPLPRRDTCTPRAPGRSYLGSAAPSLCEHAATRTSSAPLSPTSIHLGANQAITKIWPTSLTREPGEATLLQLPPSLSSPLSVFSKTLAVKRSQLDAFGRRS
jgi:hypothetical protein